MRKRLKGFTLVEVLLATSVVGIMSAAATPLVKDMLQQAKYSKATNEVSVISSALESFHKVNLSYPLSDPYRKSSEDVLHTMTTAKFVGSTKPAAPNLSPKKSVWNTKVKSRLDDYLGEGGASTYGGPFLADDRGDPWGRPYLISVGGYKCITDAGSSPVTGSPTKTGVNEWRVWILSAGPEGVIQTNPTDNKLPSGDNVGILVFQHPDNCFTPG